MCKTGLVSMLDWLSPAPDHCSQSLYFLLKLFLTSPSFYLHFLLCVCAWQGQHACLLARPVCMSKIVPCNWGHVWGCRPVGRGACYWSKWGSGISYWGEKGKGLLSSSPSVLQTLCLECQLLGTTVSELDASYWSQTGCVVTPGL